MLAEAITELPERERQILALYYHEELTLAEIGEVIGVGESRVSQLRTQAIAQTPLAHWPHGCGCRDGTPADEQDSVAGRDRRTAVGQRQRLAVARAASASPVATAYARTTFAGPTASRRSRSTRCSSCTSASRATSRRRSRPFCGR